MGPLWAIFTDHWAQDCELTDDEEDPNGPSSPLAIEDGCMEEDNSESEEVPTTQPEQSMDEDYDPYLNIAVGFDDLNLDSQPFEEPNLDSQLEGLDSKIENGENGENSDSQVVEPDGNQPGEHELLPPTPADPSAEAPGQSSLMLPPAALSPATKERKAERLAEIRSGLELQSPKSLFQVKVPKIFLISINIDFRFVRSL